MMKIFLQTVVISMLFFMACSINVHAQTTSYSGNALNFTSAGSQVIIPNSASLNPTTVTLECWLKPLDYTSRGLIIKPNSKGLGASYNEDYSFAQVNGKFLACATSNANQISAVQLSGYNVGIWYHLAAVFSSTQIRFYVNGILQQTVATGFALDHANFPLILSPDGDMNFSIDELKIWNTNRTDSIYTDMVHTANAKAQGLAAYYNFDQGVAGANNSAITTLNDLTTNTNNGTLSGFALTGSVSNWVGSYAMVIAKAESATKITGIGFTANWTAPVQGIADDYLLDVSTDSTFASFLPGYNALPVLSTSQSLTGLASGTYYYRIHVNNTSFPGEGAISNIISVANVCLTSSSSTNYIHINSSALPYSWNGLTFNAAGSQTAHLINATGCDSAATLVLTLTPPGNALDFDGATNFVDIPNNSILKPTTQITIEAWVYPHDIHSNTYCEVYRKEDGDARQLFSFQNNGTLLAFGIGINSVGYSPLAVPIIASDYENQWVHIAATYDGNTEKLYRNGVLIGTQSVSGTLMTSGTADGNLGAFSAGGEYFNGKIDEFKLWSMDRSDSIATDMKNVTNPATSGLLIYYNFDEGAIGASNPTFITLNDLSPNAINGTLINFALTGTTSNWVESYAMVVPKASAATNISRTGFTANWTAPFVGTVDNYLLDVSTDSTFSSFVSGYNALSVAATSTSQAVTGLVAGTYYFRVRANKTSVTGQGGYSNTTTVSVTCTPIVPLITITSTATTVCSGTGVMLSEINNSGLSPLFTLFVNGFMVGQSTQTSYPYLPGNGDSIVVMMDLSNFPGACFTKDTAYSNSLIFTVNNAVTPTVTLSASSVVANSKPVTFTAATTDAGTSPVYIFSVNNVSVQKGLTNTYTSATLKVGDSVSCTVTGNATCSVTDTAHSNKIVMTSNLPLTLISFGAELSVTNMLCNWQTTAEINTDKFIVERSTDGVNFTDIGSVNALGNTGKVNSYQYTDINVANLFSNTTLYYRLKMLDKDGRFTYSETVIIDLTGKSSFSIYPNPAHGFVTIDCPLSINNCQLFITDISGKVLKSQKITSKISRVDLAAICTGMYLITIQSDEGKQTNKLIVE